MPSMVTGSMVTGRTANHWVGLGSMTGGAWPCPDMHVAAISRYMTYNDDYKIILDYDIRLICLWAYYDMIMIDRNWDLSSYVGVIGSKNTALCCLKGYLAFHFLLWRHWNFDDTVLYSWPMFWHVWGRWPQQVVLLIWLLSTGSSWVLWRRVNCSPIELQPFGAHTEASSTNGSNI